jgi:mannosyltransferase
MGLGIAALGPGLPDSLPRIRFWQLPGLLRRPSGRRHRVWHARRNVEMIGGLILRHVFRAPLKLLFTSASQRQHRPLTRWLIRRMDAVIATSRKTAVYLKVPNTVIMHGIDSACFCPPADIEAAKRALGFDPAQKIAGCFGRIRHQKGTDLFVDAMIRLLPDRPDWIGIVAGRTTAEHTGFERQLREKIAAAGLTDRIRFVGEHTDIEHWYQLLSLFIAPQRWEGFGLTPLEAMACGVPVVATDVGAFSELIVEGKTGAVIQRDSLDAMVEATATYLDDDALRQSAGRASIDHVRQDFLLQQEAEKLIAVYQRLMSPGQGPSTASQRPIAKAAA